jgi:CheY-like chemotaxis protein
VLTHLRQPLADRRWGHTKRIGNLILFPPKLLEFKRPLAACLLPGLGKSISSVHVRMLAHGKIKLRMQRSVVLAYDHPPILQGLALLLRQEPDFEVLAGCRDDEETLQAVCQLRPDILILDILMPRKDGLAVLRELHQVEIPTRVILLTAAIDEDNLLEAMRLGVGGVL